QEPVAVRFLQSVAQGEGGDPHPPARDPPLEAADPGDLPERGRVRRGDLRRRGRRPPLLPPLGGGAHRPPGRRAPRLPPPPQELASGRQDPRLPAGGALHPAPDGGGAVALGGDLRAAAYMTAVLSGRPALRSLTPWPPLHFVERGNVTAMTLPNQ